MPYTSIKGQVLADLVAKFVESPIREDKEERVNWRDLPAGAFILEDVC